MAWCVASYNLINIFIVMACCLTAVVLNYCLNQFWHVIIEITWKAIAFIGHCYRIQNLHIHN